MSSIRVVEVRKAVAIVVRDSGLIHAPGGHGWRLLQQGEKAAATTKTGTEETRMETRLRPRLELLELELESVEIGMRKRIQWSWLVATAIWIWSIASFVFLCVSLSVCAPVCAVYLVCLWPMNR